MSRDSLERQRRLVANKCSAIDTTDRWLVQWDGRSTAPGRVARVYGSQLFGRNSRSTRSRNLPTMSAGMLNRDARIVSRLNADDISLPLASARTS